MSGVRPWVALLRGKVRPWVLGDRVRVRVSAARVPGWERALGGFGSLFGVAVNWGSLERGQPPRNRTWNLQIKSWAVAYRGSRRSRNKNQGLAPIAARTEGAAVPLDLLGFEGSWGPVASQTRHSSGSLTGRRYATIAATTARVSSASARLGVSPSWMWRAVFEA